MKSIRRQQSVKLDAQEEDYLDLFGREETRVGIFGKYIGAANFFMQEDLRRDESNLKSKENNSLRQLDRSSKTQKSKTFGKKSKRNSEKRVLKLLSLNEMRYFKAEPDSDDDIKEFGL
jgi:hypothetical protein